MTIQPTALVPNAAPGAFSSPQALLSNIVDVINPLQHIPFVSQVYRAATGDTISTGAQILGGGLFGGVAGAAVSAVTAAVEGMAGGEGAIMSQAETLVKSAADKVTGTERPAAAAGATPLISDQGEALVGMISDGTFTRDPRQPKPPVAASPPVTTVRLHDFREARPLGISGPAIEPQMKAQLAAEANKILS